MSSITAALLGVTVVCLFYIWSIFRLGEAADRSQELFSEDEQE